MTSLCIVHISCRRAHSQYWLYYGRRGVCLLYSSAVLSGHHTEFNDTLPHVWKWARCENYCPKFGVPPQNVGPKNYQFLGGYQRLCNL